MKTVSLLCALLGVLALAGAAGAADHVAVGPGQSIVVENPSPDTICLGAEFRTNDDGSYENGYAWAYGGVAAPTYGAWAEGFDLGGNTSVCGVKFGLTQVGGAEGWLMDVYVWDAAGDNPNNVTCVVTGVNPGGIGMWPTITQHEILVPFCQPATASFFVGWWPQWIGSSPGWYVAADENGFGGGLPRTNIAPGIGFPTGWQHPNVVSTFAGCMDLGIGVYGFDGIVPVDQITWGGIKFLYR